MRLVPQKLLMPAEVAALFGVSAKTVWLWGSRGRLPFIQTPGGHKRYPAEAVYALLRGEA